jgi:tetratricopeptide (TPR) repeat protein
MQDSLDLRELEQQVENEKRGANSNGLMKLISVLSYGSLAIIVVMGFITMFNGNFISSLFDMIPDDLELLIFIPLGLVFFLTSIITLLNMARSTKDNSKQRMERELERMPPLGEAPKSRGSMVMNVIYFVLGIGGVFLTQYFKLPLLAAFLIFVPLLFVMIAVELLLKHWITHGNYDAARKLAKLFLRFTSSDAPLYGSLTAAQATALMFSGKVDDSIPYYLQHLNVMRRTRNPYQISGSLNNLGYALVMAERYDEALPFLEAAIRIKPDLSHAYDSLAGYYLEQGILPKRALEVAQAALEYTPNAKSTSRGIQIATSARASAMAGNANYAKILLSEALTMVGKTHTDAEIYRQAGYTLQAMGDVPTARKYFQQAIKLNPQGLFGQKARRALLATKEFA